MEPRRIRVLCADDHPLVREGIRAVLKTSEDFEVVAAVGSGEEAVAMFQQHRPDVVLMDLKMPGISGLEAIKRIRAESPDARIVVLTTYQGNEDIYQAIQAGAATYVLKEAVAENLIPLLRTVCAGGRPIPEAIAARLAEQIGLPRLTGRESDVLDQMAKGLRNKEIAWNLGITEETVQVHVRNILSKLNVHDRTEAVMVAIRRGILHVN
jgi:DNA-binding NarL/FixJ family response regulator